MRLRSALEFTFISRSQLTNLTLAEVATEFQLPNIGALDQSFYKSYTFLQYVEALETPKAALIFQQEIINNSIGLLRFSQIVKTYRDIMESNFFPEFFKRYGAYTLNAIAQCHSS